VSFTSLEIDSTSKELGCATDRPTKKALRTKLVDLQTSLNVYVEQEKNNIRDAMITYLFSLESMKNEEGLLPESHYADVKWVYSSLADLSRINCRYVKLPKMWVRLGFLAGVLEDLVVVMRTSSQLGISNNHLITLAELTSGLRGCTHTDDGELRFPFLNKLLEQGAQVPILLQRAIASQGKARRIAIYQDTHYYAIQGLLGGVKYDPRVITTLTTETAPPFAVHFTTSEIASAIWHSQTTTVTKRTSTRSAEIQIGWICKFDRAIHALTNISYDGKYYHIVTSDKDIKDRMTHGIKDTNVRPKYESGLVIDLKVLTAGLPHGMVQMNELGTLLVGCDIPHEYLLALISTDDELTHFWCD
jgi:hypothetical protein